MTKTIAFLVCSVSAVALGAPGASAQEASKPGQEARDAAPNPAPNDGLSEIVVTAQHRSESLQKVPIAITAINAEALDARGVDDILDLRTTVPALNVSYNVGFVNPYLRGIGSNAGGPGVENPIAIYVDGVYVGSTAASMLSFSNIERLEVLKGPQGTLFGRNATGGLVQVVTKEPTQALSGAFRLTYANYNKIRGEAYLAGGLTDTLRGDIAVQATHQSDGWGQNVATGQKVYAIEHDIAVRSKWVFEPNSDTKFTLIGDYADIKDTLGMGVLVPGTVNPYNPTPPVLPGRYDALANRNLLHTNQQGGVSLRWDQNLGELSFASITAYRKNRWELQADLDISVLDVSFLRPTQIDDQFSQEFQLLSPSGGPFTWVLGAYYFHSKGEYSPLEVDLPLAGIGIRTISTQTGESLAGFAQGTYEIAPGTKVTLGGRYTTEKRSLVGRQSAYAYPSMVEIPGFPGLLTPIDTSRRFNKFTFRIAADQQLSQDALLYASFNRGFKSGGYNAGLPVQDPVYTPETLDAYEVGLKTTLNNTVRFNLAAFYYDYKNLQVQELLGGTINVVNGGAAKLYGAEAEFEAKITPDLLFNASASYLHSEFTDFPNAPISSPDGSQPIVIGSAKGNRLPFAPTVTVNAGLSYRVDFAGGDLNLNGNIYFNSGWFGAADNVIEQKAFEQINLSAKWNDATQRLSVEGWVKNLNNVQVQAYQSVFSDGTQYIQWAAPRTYGITLGYNF
jgi:iron complex outermembrane recepter protein